jgi:cell division protein FtsI (penicillin-binding protein 3)
VSGASRSVPARRQGDRTLGLRLRYAAVVLTVIGAFATVATQLVRLGIAGQNQAGPAPTLRLANAETLVRATARPDIIDRRGRLLATDIQVPSVFVDPHLILDVDHVTDRLAARFTDLDPAELRAALADKSKRFVWIKRRISPQTARAIHEQGLTGIGFRMEARRGYPQGHLASHLIGSVGADHQGLAGIERMIDQMAAGKPPSPARETPAPVRLTLDIGVQYSLETELRDAVSRHQAKAAAGVLIDVTTGDVIAAASLPSPDPDRPTDAQDPDRIDRLTVGSYELGSIFKMLTVALALDQKLATLDTIYDVRVPLTIGAYTIRDLHPAGRPLSVREIFIQSSNVGAGMMALQAGTPALRSFVGSLGLLQPMRWDVGTVAAPRTPARWGKIETVTVSYGHGIAVAPLQFVAAGAALVNGGTMVDIGILADRPQPADGRRVISAATSQAIAELMRRNVTQPRGTGRRAEIDGLDIGGKTGTAEIAVRGGYRQKAVISSFFAAFPAAKPRYALLTMVFEPQASAETQGQITAGVIAAPLAGRIIARAAPLLDGASIDPPR